MSPYWHLDCEVYESVLCWIWTLRHCPRHCHQMKRVRMRSRHCVSWASVRDWRLQHSQNSPAICRKRNNTSYDRCVAANKLLQARRVNGVTKASSPNTQPARTRVKQESIGLPSIINQLQQSTDIFRM